MRMGTIFLSQTLRGVLRQLSTRKNLQLPTWLLLAPTEPRLQVGTHGFGYFQRHVYSSSQPHATFPASEVGNKKQKLSDCLVSPLEATTKELSARTAYLVGVATFQEPREDVSASQPELLVLKRAASDSTFPNMWAVPGGHVEADETIRQAIERETHEETGLKIERVIGEFKEVHWQSPSGKENVQLNLVVEVKDTEGVRLNPEEHSQWRWVSERDAMELHCTGEMADVFANAFECAEEIL